MQIGPKAREQLTRMATVWNQGDHVLVTGGTGSGKTLLARQLDQIRLDRGGHVIVFMAKLQPDDTITKNYRGFKRWTTWHRHPTMTENRILFWPKVEGKTPTEARAILKREYRKALNEIGKTGKWTVHIDEGWWTCDPAGLGLRDEIGLMYALMRSAKGTMVTLAQRPAHLPVAIYPNTSHAFVGRASELPDLRRLADLDGKTSSRELQRMISENGKHDFIWIPVGTNGEPERINLAE